MRDEHPDTEPQQFKQDKAAHCRSCGAAVIWAETEKGKRIPVDPTPVEGGNIRFIVRYHLPPVAVIVPKGVTHAALQCGAVCYYGTESEIENKIENEKRGPFPKGWASWPLELYKSHFATCPNAQKHRKPR